MENQNVNPLITVGGEELLEMQLPPKEFVIEGLLPKGLAMLVGSPKVGKSFLSLQVALAVSCGENLWIFPTPKGHVLYLALEDDLARLQKRVKEMNDSATNDVRFATMSERLHQGLIEQMDAFISQFPDTNLVIIDTLQHIRDNEKKQGGNLYAQDYTEQMSLQRYALDKGIAILLVHHTNKLKGRDPIEAASGSNGMTAALDTYWYLDRPKRELPQAKLFVISRDIGEMVFKIEKQGNGEWTMLEGKEFAKTKTNPYVAIIAFYLHFCVWPYEEEPQPYVTTPTKLVEDILSCSIEPKFNFNARRTKIELNANHLQLESLGILFDGTYRTVGERQLVFTPITEDNKPPYEIKPGKLFEDIKVDIELVDDINDVMTSVTYMGEKSKSVVTAPFNDITNKNDDLCPLPKVTSLMSQTSLPSQTVRIDASDPISFLAKVMQHNLSASGVNVTPFEEFCKQQEEKERKKKEAEQKYIDVEFSYASKEISVPVENKITLYCKNKIDAAVIFLKAFLLRARLKSA